MNDWSFNPGFGILGGLGLVFLTLLVTLMGLQVAVLQYRVAGKESSKKPEAKKASDDALNRFKNWSVVLAYAGSLFALAFFPVVHGILFFQPASLTWLVTLLPLSITLLFHGLPTLYRAFPTGLTPHAQPLHHAYFRLTPYGVSEGEVFQRADGCHLQAVRWLGDPSGRLFYLTGLSGCGKTSLLKAHVLPTLEAQGVAVVSLRMHGDPLATLQRELCKPGRFWRKPPDITDTRDLLRRATLAAERPILLVWDQFEESLILHQQEGTAQLLELLVDLHHHPLAGLGNLLVLRTDYQAFLGEQGFPPLVQGQNWMEVPPFSVGAAMDFLREAKLNLSDGDLTSLVRVAEEVDGTAGAVRPVTLNLLGMAHTRLNSPPRFAGRLMHDWLRRVFRQSKIHQLAPPLLRAMITRYGTKKPCGLEELAKNANKAPLQIRDCLVCLQREGLVNPLDASQQHWEISHDFLARLLDRVLSPQRKSFAGIAHPWLGIMVLVMWFLWLIPNGRDYFRPADEVLRELGVPHGIGDGRTSVRFSRRTDASIRRAIPHLQRFKVDTLSVNFSETKLSKIPEDKGFNGRLYDFNDLHLLSGLTELRNLSFASTSLRSLDRFPELTNLSELKLDCPRLVSFSGMPSLQMLISLEIKDARSLKNLEGLPNLPNLDSFLLLRTNGPRNLEGMPVFPKLTKLDLYAWESLNTLKGMPLLPKLEILGLGCTSLLNLEGLPNHPELKTLHMSFNYSLKDLKGCPVLPNLKVLNLFNVGSLESLEGLPNLPKLEKLILSGTENLKSLEALPSLPALKILNLSRTYSLTTLDELPMLLELIEIRIQGSGAKQIGSILKRRLPKLLSLQAYNSDVESINQVPVTVKYLNCSPSFSFEGYHKEQYPVLTDVDFVDYGKPKLARSAAQKAKNQMPHLNVTWNGFELTSRYGF